LPYIVVYTVDCEADELTVIAVRSAAGEGGERRELLGRL
jgi:hypothetical protein